VLSLRMQLTRRLLLTASTWGLLLAVAACGSGSGGGDDSRLQTTWSAAMQDFNKPVLTPAPAPASFQNQTIRQRMRLSLGGSHVRVRVSNVFGTAPLVVDGLSIAKPSTDAAAAVTDIDPGSAKALTFDGAASVTVPAGQERWSDEVAFNVAGRSDVLLSVFVANTTPVATFHSFASQQGGAVPGNALTVGVLSNPTRVNSVYWLSKIDVRSSDARAAIVAIGDSITDGAGTTSGANRRWTNQLDARIAADPSLVGVGVVNAGILGNRILFDGIGPRALDRFSRDVLEVSQVRTAIVLLGINDINIGPTVAGQDVTAQQVIDGLSAMVQAGRRAGVRVVLGTITPNKGFARYPFTQAGEAKRQAVNAWIRSNTGADGFIDFDAVLRNPADPTTINPAYNSGDNLHPNDAGAKAIADAVSLTLIAG
jgi:lysophospholipase L1-like esterase